MNVEPRLKPLVPKKVPMLRDVFGSQMEAASPMNASISPIVTASWATSGASFSRRMSTRSMTPPSSGAATSTVKRNATSVWRPRSTFSSQYTNAISIPMAPCAKLKIPDVV